MIRELNHVMSLGSITFNTNILETNVINILILVIGLIYLSQNFILSILRNRRERVLSAVQEAEERLQQARERFAEAEKQFSSSQQIVKQIEQDAEATGQNVKNSILSQGQSDIEKLHSKAENNITNTELQVKKQIQEQIISLALKRALIKIKNNLDNETYNKILDRNISKLGEKI